MYGMDYRGFLPPANEVWGKVIFSVACVKNSVHSGGGGLLQCMLGYHPPWQADTPPPPWQAGTPLARRIPPPARQTSQQGDSPSGKADAPGKADPPWQGDPPSAQCMLGDTVNKRAVCILLECNLV